MAADITPHQPHPVCPPGSAVPHHPPAAVADALVALRLTTTAALSSA